MNKVAIAALQRYYYTSLAQNRFARVFAVKVLRMAYMPSVSASVV